MTEDLMWSRRDVGSARDVSRRVLREMLRRWDMRKTLYRGSMLSMRWVDMLRCMVSSDRIIRPLSSHVIAASIWVWYRRWISNVS